MSLQKINPISTQAWQKLKAHFSEIAKIGLFYILHCVTSRAMMFLLMEKI